MIKTESWTAEMREFFHAALIGLMQATGTLGAEGSVYVMAMLLGVASRAAGMSTKGVVELVRAGREAARPLLDHARVTQEIAMRHVRNRGTAKDAPGPIYTDRKPCVVCASTYYGSAELPTGILERHCTGYVELPPDKRWPCPVRWTQDLDALFFSREMTADEIAAVEANWNRPREEVAP